MQIGPAGVKIIGIDIPVSQAGVNPMSSTVKVSIIIGVLSVSQLAFGQGRRGGWGGRDANRPMTKEEIAQRIARTADLLKNIDANGNGIIDAGRGQR